MDTTLTKWGNSMAIRIPKAFIEEIGVSEGDSINLKLDDNKIIISKNKLNLEDLLSSISPEKIHKETSTGNIIGKEIW